MLEHVNCPQAVISEIYRVLRPGGQLIVTFPGKYLLTDPHYGLYFINWMPKKLAERYIKLRGRSKEKAPYRDIQKFSKMNYMSYNEFKNLARGFRVIEYEKKNLRIQKKLRIP